MGGFGFDRDLGGTLGDPFILEDGTLNPASIGIQDTIPFRSSLLGANNVAFNDVDSGLAIEFNRFASDDVGITTDSGGYGEGHVWVYNSGVDVGYGYTNYTAYDTNAVVTSSSGRIELNAVTGGIIIDKAGIASGKGIFVTLPDGATGTTDTNQSPSIISSENTTHDGTVFTPRYNSAAIGGSGLVIDKDGYAFMQNAEIQGGLLNLTTGADIIFNNGGFTGTLSEGTYSGNIVNTMPDIAGKLSVNSGADWSGLTNGVTDRTVDFNSFTLDELGDAFFTLVQDLRTSNYLT